MKKLFCLSAALFVAVSLVMADRPVVGNGRDINKKKENRREEQKDKMEISLYPPDRVVAFQFSQDFPNAKNVTWTSGEFVEASFLDNTVLKTAYYDRDDNLVGTTTDVDASALPEKARDYISKKYPGYTIEQVVFFDDNEANDTDMFLYNQSFDDEDNYFPLLSNGSKQIILKVSTEGRVSFFQELK